MSPKKLTKDNLDFYLSELAKEYRKLCGKTNPAEIILVGGASILINYNFRKTTEDVDAIIGASSAIKDAAHRVSDKYGLKSDWFNSDFEYTKSYSDELILYSKYYKTYSNVIHFRTVSGEYLLAMKLMSNRKYKNDRSDIVGIIKSERQSGNYIKIEDIKKALNELYGPKAIIDKQTYDELLDILNTDNLDNKFKETRAEEKENKKALLTFIKDNPSNIRIDNVDEAIELIKKKNKK